ncbi:MAG: hypothetical protein V3W44_04295 [Dehalococcoidales bacterium]
MTTFNLGQYVSALEVSKHGGEDGPLTPLIHALSQVMEMYGDVHMEVANDGDGHKGLQQSSQPTGSYRMFNEGIATEAPSSVGFREPLVMLDGRFQADRRMLMSKAGGDRGKAKEIRARMIVEYIIGMLKTFQTSIFYGTRADGKSPLGLTQRSDWNALSSDYVYDNAGGAASATANKASLWLIGHGPEKYTWIHGKDDAPSMNTIEQPEETLKGVGVTVEALRDELVADASGTATNQFMAVRNYLEMHLSHAIMDGRYVRRQVNISMTAQDGVDDFAFDEEPLIDMLEDIPDLENAVMYCNKPLRAQIRKRINVKGNIWHTVTDPFGRQVPGIDNVPLHIVERLTSAEATVT